MSDSRQPPLVLPMRDGVSASCTALPHHVTGTVLAYLVQHLQGVPESQWRERMAAGDVVDEHGQRLSPGSPAVPGLRVYYYRSLPPEPDLPFEARLVYRDAHLLVADKPHFMPVMPAGRYLQNTLLVRLKREFDLPDLVPLHRIDRDTAGLVMFSVQRATRGVYHALFSGQQINKHYEAVAPWRADLGFPREHHSRMEESPQFFRMHEVPGAPNSHTYMELIEKAESAADTAQPVWARYRLSPISGKRHQLRVHMAALGLPLRNDPYYPELNDRPEDDYSTPLQLLAKSLQFTDPVTGELRKFESQQQLLALNS